MENLAELQRAKHIQSWLVFEWETTKNILELYIKMGKQKKHHPGRKKW